MKTDFSVIPLVAFPPLRWNRYRRCCQTPLMTVGHHGTLAVVCSCCPKCELHCDNTFCPWLCECIMSWSDKTSLECPVSSACLQRVLNSKMDCCAGESSAAGANTVKAFSVVAVALWPSHMNFSLFALCKTSSIGNKVDLQMMFLIFFNALIKKQPL